MDQVRGGGAGGVFAQSGGTAASTPRLAADVMKTVRDPFIRKPTTELPHFFRHVVASGHFDLLSQHSQSEVVSPLLVFSQSSVAVLSPPLAFIAMLARADAHADAIGATVSDTLITNSRRRRRWRNDGVLSPSP
jgi:hypothetical protein